MRPLSTICRAFVLLLLAAGTARAVTILDLTDESISASDPTQLGRLSRNGIPQDWADSEPYPDVINPSVSYLYHVYTVNVGSTPYIQISVNSDLISTFFAAYDGSYDPTNPAATWLGDSGFSGNPFPGDPSYFQVFVPMNHDLLIVVNGTSPAPAGAGDPFDLLVEGFIDTEYTDPAPVPEPDTLLLSGGGLILLAVGRFLRQGA